MKTFIKVFNIIANIAICVSLLFAIIAANDKPFVSLALIVVITIIQVGKWEANKKND